MSTSAWPLVRAFRDGRSTGLAESPRPEEGRPESLEDGLEPVGRADSSRADLDEPELAARLQALVDTGRAAWPGIGAIDPEGIARYVGARSGASCDVDPRRGGEYVIAHACAAGSTAAIAALEDAASPVLVPALRRLRLDDAAIDEVRARLRVSLFVPSEGRPPYIASWSGRGDLLGWLRVCAVREGLKALRRGRAERGEALDLASEVASLGSDPHELYELRTYAPLFREALAAALGQLEPRERALLAQHHLDGLSIDRLAALHGVHRATAARWVVAARERLIESARAAFQARTRLEDSACASVMRRIRPELDLTLRRVLEGK